MSKKVIDLSGPEGNVFYLMGLVKQLSKMTGDDDKKILDDMMSSDYNHAVEVFEYHFSEYVELINK